MKPRITQKDIAAESGVSQQVVSAVLGTAKDSPASVRFSAETRRKVLDARRRLGYRPNRMARGLQGKRHDALGLLVLSVNYVPRPALEALLSEAKATGCVLTIESFAADYSDPITILDEDCVDGLLLFQDMPARIVERIDKLGLPSVWINTNEHARTGSIVFDEARAVEQAVEVMTANGRRNIGIVTNTLETEYRHYSEDSRVTALQAALERRGLSPAPVCRFSSDHPLDRVQEMASSLEVFMNDNPAIEGFVVSGDSLAPALYEAAARRSLEIGREISVISFNNEEICQALRPALTSFGIDYRSMAEVAVDRLSAMIAGEEPQGFPVMLEYKLFERESHRTLND